VSEFARMRRRNINYFKKNPELIDPGETAESMAAKIGINPETVKGKKDGGLAEAIEKVKAKEMKVGGEAVPPKFKGFSKLPESVQQKMNPDLAEKFGMGGDVKGKKSGNICRGRGIARPGTGFTIR
jgi:hypothetical protein